MTTKKLEIELQSINKKLDENIKELQEVVETSRKSNKKRKRTLRDNLSSGRFLGD